MGKTEVQGPVVQDSSQTFVNHEDDQSSMGEVEVTDQSFGVCNQISWVLLGLFNNVAWTITYASAAEITSMSYGLTYVANTLPCLLICVIAPYTFHMIPYEVRMVVAGLCGIVAMILVGIPGFLAVSANTGMIIQLIGVVCVGLQCQIGECTLLPYAGAYGGSKARRLISCYSSGTGIAGVLGGFYPVLMEEVFGLSLSVAVLIALFIPVCYLVLFFCVLDRRHHTYALEDTASRHATEPHNQSFSVSKLSIKDTTLEEGNRSARSNSTARNSWNLERTQDQNLSVWARVKAVAGLWYYILPLFIVYFAEYFIQSGTWSAIGVPDVYSEEDRARFYHYAALAYQCGVFISRSSGLLISPNYLVIAMMPVAQLVMLGLFTAIAITQFWGGWTLLIPAFVVGLWGGAGYVLTYVHIAENVSPDMIEFSVATTTVAENLGLTVSAFTGMYMQGCMWKSLGIPGGLAC